MHSTALSLALVFVLPAPASTASAGSIGKIFIGDGVTSHGSSSAFTGSDHQPFDAALSAVASLGDGWQIEVLPGDYRFGATVGIDSPGMRIYGSRSVVIGPGASFTGSLFDVEPTATGFTLAGMTFEETRDAAVDLVSIRAGGATVSDCVFRALGTASTAQGYLLALDGSSEGLQGAHVLANAFLFGSSSAERTGLRVTAASGVRVLANEFRPGAGVTGPAAIRSAIRAEDATGCLIRANTFLDLEAAVAGAADDALLHCGQTEDGAGMTISANVFGGVSGASIVHLSELSNAVVNGNVLAVSEVGTAAVHVEGGTGAAITANQLHDVEGDAAAAVVLDTAEAAMISGNSFLDAAANQVVLDGVDGASVIGNRFSQAAGASSLVAVEVVSPSARVVIGANAARGSAWGTSISTGTATLFSNHVQ